VGQSQVEAVELQTLPLGQQEVPSLQQIPEVVGQHPKLSLDSQL